MILVPLQVFFALTLTAMGVTQTSGLAPDLNKAKDSAASIFDILDSKPKIDSSKDEGSTIASVKGDIEFQHVSFKYPTRPNIPIFRDLCLTIPSGKVINLAPLDLFIFPMIWWENVYPFGNCFYFQNFISIVIF